MKITASVKSCRPEFAFYTIDVLFNSIKCWVDWIIFTNKVFLDSYKLNWKINTKYPNSCENCINIDLCIEENKTIIDNYILENLNKRKKIRKVEKNETLIKKELNNNWKSEFESWFTTFPDWYINWLKKQKDFFK